MHALQKLLTLVHQYVLVRLLILSRMLPWRRRTNLGHRTKIRFYFSFPCFRRETFRIWFGFRVTQRGPAEPRRIKLKVLIFPCQSPLNTFWQSNMQLTEKLYRLSRTQKCRNHCHKLVDCVSQKDFINHVDEHICPALRHIPMLF